MDANAFKVGMRAPDDVSAAAELLDRRAFSAEHVVAILGKTEGNGAVNDYTRALATLSFQMLLAERTGKKIQDIAKRVPIIWSGGTEGLMAPHATIITRLPDRRPPAAGQKRFAVGTAYTRDLLPEEFGTAVHAQVAAEGVKAAIADAGIESLDDLHFVQIKTGALTTDRIAAARSRGRSVVTTDTYKSMSYARAVAALGIGAATGEIPAAKLSDDVVCHDFSVFSNVASTSSGVELMNCEIIVLGNSARSSSELVMAHAVMRDAIDATAVREALRRAGLALECELSERDQARLINVFAKCEPDASGATRGRRHVMFEDGDINYTRHIRGVVNAVIASVTGDTMCYVSAGAEHQGPPGGGVVAVLARV
ncbi:MAG: cyanuric acid amidohydrolase [Candidatus Rokuibacteriota bacterium]|nr:MAG: cyanuric acid amidohydrolase [Candidatus Rokubacteria bacterium]